MGIPATGKQVEVSGINIAHIQGRKVIERWEVDDMMGMMAQLGVFSPSEG